MKQAIIAFVALVFLFFTLGFIRWDGRSGLQHIDKAMGSTALYGTFAALTGRANDALKDTRKATDKAYDATVVKAHEAAEKVKQSAEDAEKATSEHQKEFRRLVNEKEDEKHLDNIIDNIEKKKKKN